MGNRTLKNEDIKGAVDLYKSLPAATFFRGLTGYGLISESGVEKVGEITSSSGIWKPMYFFINGGEKKGRTTLTAENIKKAVEKFAQNELFAMLKISTGKGIKVDNSVSQLVDINEATTGINFELNHFGGRSIVPRLEVELSKLQDPNIKWQSGFLYQSQGNNAPTMNKNLILTRVLAEEEFGGQESFDRVWQDIDKEVKRLMFMQCDSNSLPTSGIDNGSDRVRAFFSQELTTLVPRVQIDIRKPGYEYSVRNDGTVVVQKSIRPFEYQDEQKFTEFMTEFTKECYRVYTLYCNPLTDAQRQKLGRPSGDDSGLIEAETGEFERDERRSTETNEQLISWVGRAPGFPFEGWQPEKGKEYFMLRHAWGRGYRLSPGIPRYEERITAKDKKIALRQVVRIEYDGTEKVIKEESVHLQSENRPEQDRWDDEFIACVGKKATIRQTRQSWIGIYHQVVKSNWSGGNTIEWQLMEKVDEDQETRNIVVSISGIGAKEKNGWSEIEPTSLDLSSYVWIIKIHDKTADGDDYSSSFSLNWKDLSSEIRAEQETAYPVCACGHSRHVANVLGCEHCHNYCDCPRCGKTDQLFGSDRIQAGATCCQNCSEWYEGREEWIHNHFSTNDLQKIRDNAQTLINAPICCDVQEQSGQELCLMADGLYAPYFNAENLIKLANLPNTGNDLVTFIWWLIKGKEQSDLSPDFAEHNVAELKNKLDSDENLLARFVRINDEIVIETVVGKISVTPAPGDDPSELTPEMIKSLREHFGG